MKIEQTIDKIGDGLQNIKFKCKSKHNKSIQGPQIKYQKLHIVFKYIYKILNKKKFIKFLKMIPKNVVCGRQNQEDHKQKTTICKENHMQ